MLNSTSIRRPPHLRGVVVPHRRVELRRRQLVHFDRARVSPPSPGGARDDEACVEEGVQAVEGHDVGAGRDAADAEAREVAHALQEARLRRHLRANAPRKACWMLLDAGAPAKLVGCLAIGALSLVPSVWTFVLLPASVHLNTPPPANLHCRANSPSFSSALSVGCKPSHR